MSGINKILLSAILGVVAALLLISPGQSSASPIGDIVDITIINAGIPFPFPGVPVVPGPEGVFTWFDGILLHDYLIDIEAGTIDITDLSGFPRLVGATTVEISDIQWIDPTTGLPQPGSIVFVGCIDLTTGSPSPVTWTANSITISIPFGLPPADIFCEFSAEHKEPCVKFTVKGEDIPDSENCNPDANDITVVFRGPATMQFTRDGSPVGDPIPKAKGANDFEVNFVPGTCDIISGTWTNKGVEIGTISIPIDSATGLPPNDFWFVAKRIVSATWTLDGEPIADIPRPKGHVTDIHLDCRLIDG